MSAEIILDPSQEAAVELALTARICVITGGPGVGKSTILKVLLDRIGDEPITIPAADELDFPAQLSPYVLASPTGKASKRLSEATGRRASTVHRLLEYGPVDNGRSGFRRNESTPLDTALVIVDEASMLDVELAAALMAAIDPARTRLILVGDVNQLPSVGPGRVFGDLIDSGEVPVARLTTLHRAAQESWVCRNAPRVLAGTMPELVAATGDGTFPDFVWRKAETRDDAIREVLDYAAMVTDETQILVPQKTGPAGTDELNARLQSIVNDRARPGELSWGKAPHAIYAGDRVIQTRNDYALGVFNGEVGRVTSLDKEAVVVDFDDRIVRYDRDSARGLRLAYALTIHKFQGSEVPWAVVLCHSTHHFMLSRQLLYTAITRAKKGVVLVGDRKGIEAAIANMKPAVRNTGLVAKLREREE